MTEFWVRVVLHEKEDTQLVYFCDRERLYNGNWVIPHYLEGYGGLCPDQIYGLFPHNRGGQWKGQVMRRIYLEGGTYGHPGCFHFRILLKGTCYLCSDLDESNAIEELVAVDFPSPMGLSPESALAAKDRLLVALNDERSEIRFALEWLYMTPFQRQEKSLRFERGTLSEMQNLMRAALHCQSDLWEIEETFCWETRDWHTNDYFEDVQGSAIKIDRSTHHRFYPPAYTRVPIPTNADILLTLQRWKHSLWSYFEPSFNEELFDRFQCVRDASEDVATITGVASPPTAHERLEARLLLQDWWRDKYSPLLFGATGEQDQTSANHSE